MIFYKFKFGNISVNLEEPTVECLKSTLENPFMNFLMTGSLKKDIIKSFEKKVISGEWVEIEVS